MNRSPRPVPVALAAVALLAGGCATVPTSDVTDADLRQPLGGGEAGRLPDQQLTDIVSP